MSNDTKADFSIWYDYEQYAREAEAEYAYQKENNTELEEVLAKRENEDISLWERVRESRRNLWAAEKAAALHRGRADAYMEVVKFSIQLVE